MNELEQYQVALDAMLTEGDVDKAIAFYAQWNPGGDVMSCEAAEIAIHKVRIVRGIGVKESKAWLSQRGYSTSLER